LNAPSSRYSPYVLEAWPQCAQMTTSSNLVRQGPQIQTKVDTTIWYLQPAEKWLDAMALGNGYMGAMVSGRLQEERIALNESSFWSGRPLNYADLKWLRGLDLNQGSRLAGL
jgi:hypothetical protein